MDNIDLENPALSKFLAKPTNEAMAELQDLVTERQTVVEALEKYKNIVKRGEKRLEDLDERLIPEVMDRCGQMECRLSNGLRVKIEEKLFGNIPAQSTIESCKDDEERARLQERRDKAYEWLDENAPDVVKRTFEIKFSRSDEDQALADKFERDLKRRKHPLPVQRSATVAPQTLCKLIRDRREEDLPLPWDLLGIHEKRVAKISLK